MRDQWKTKKELRDELKEVRTDRNAVFQKSEFQEVTLSEYRTRIDSRDREISTLEEAVLHLGDILGITDQYFETVGKYDFGLGKIRKSVASAIVADLQTVSRGDKVKEARKRLGLTKESK